MTKDTDARMRELDEKEARIREGIPVHVESMGTFLRRKENGNSPSALGSNSADRLKTREDRLKVAALIVELSNKRLSLSPTNNTRYIALKIGSGPNSNAIRVRNSRVSFFIRSTGLLNKAKYEGFDPQPLRSTTAANKDKFRFWGLRLSDIEAHEALFREIVKESVETIMDRRPKKH
jgi:hypothetical protein